LRRLQLLLAATWLCCAAFGQSAKPNYSGMWKLNYGKSTQDNPPDPYIDVISQTPTKISVTTKAAGVTNLLDGEYPTLGKLRIEKMSDKYRYTKVGWEGSTLVFEITDKDGKKETSKALMYVRESWTLSGDGKVLTKFRRTAGGPKIVDQKYVFDKQ
jgi:hypothetical protein